MQHLHPYQQQILAIFTAVLLEQYQREHTMGNITFLDLPRELRDIVYQYVISERVQLVQPGCKDSLESNGILLANHQLREEYLYTLRTILPATTVVLHRHPGDNSYSVLASPAYTGFRQNITNLIVRLPFRKRNVNFFSLLRKSEQHTDIYIRRLLDCMPALRIVTCEITWEPNYAQTVLLPRIRERMVDELRRASIGPEELLEGWHVECQIRDATRWKNEWSGAVILTK
jgi:hypothetical protein